MKDGKKPIPPIDLSPETICGIVIDAQEAMIDGRMPNEAQARACQLANASPEVSKALRALLGALTHVALPACEPLTNAVQNAWALLRRLGIP